MNHQTDSQLLRAYAENHSETAFAELVRRHVDFVYSAARRMVVDPHLSEDVTQSVFVAFAKNAAQLSDRPVLSGWLHRTAQNIAAQTVRTIERRRAREQEAVAMNELLANETDADWENIAPHLDAALGELSEPDRDALLLRYFEKKSAREMSAMLNVSEEAAQKRVNRAVERLREFFSKRKVTIGASGLVVLISANAVQAAPIGLLASISTAISLAGTAIQTSTAIAATKTIAMTTLQKTLITTAVALAVGTSIYETRRASQLREQNQILRQQQALLSDELRQLRRERDRATNQLTAVTDELAREKKSPSEVLKLRGKLGVLRQEKANSDGQSAVSKIIANPETRKAMREREKTAMSGLYADLAKRLKLTPEQTAQFNDLLADHVMDNFDLVMQALHDGKSQAEVRQSFSESDTAFQEKVRSLLGDDASTQFQDYTRNLSSTLFVESFGSSLTGDSAAVADKKSRLLQIMQEETQSTLAAAGLPADYQTLTVLNFGNYASEQEGAQSLQLKDDIFGQVAARAAAFLNADELKKLQEFRIKSIENSRNIILMNRKMMTPVSK